MQVSVIIPAYNAEKYIAESITSVLKQSYPVLEIIVIDDGSIDNTSNIARSFGDIVHIIRQTNSGVSTARNNGIIKASGDLIAYLDADDTWTPRKLEYQVAYLVEHRDVVAVASGFKIFGTDSKTFDVFTHNATFLKYQPIDHLTSPKVHLSTLVVRSSVTKKIHFLEGIGDAEDLIYFANLRCIGLIGSVDKILAGRRQHPDQATQCFLHFTRGLKARIAWAKENHLLIHKESPSLAESDVLNGAVRHILASYWARDFKRFRQWRRELLTIWPKDIAVPNDLLRFTPPKFFITLVDILHLIRNRKISSSK